jgi:hypothetical protein
MSEEKKAPNKSMMFALLGVFIVPVILAKFALDYGWFNKAATNKGELLDPILSLSTMGIENTHKWRILYVLPETCAAECENALYSINQVWLALGKEMDRAQAVALTTETSDQVKLSALEQQSNIYLIKSEQQSVNQVFQQVSTDGIFIVDTLDNVILRYPLQQEQQQAVLHSREILADLRKLLKLSRIG